MAESVDAVYEDGVLRLSKPLAGVQEHSRVRVTVETASEGRRPLADCVGILPDDDAEEMSRIIKEAFEQVNPREWD
jgi:predicted DNA-binding antitoxin AbrB/MazE fold protein